MRLLTGVCIYPLNRVGGCDINLYSILGIRGPLPSRLSQLCSLQASDVPPEEDRVERSLRSGDSSSCMCDGQMLTDQGPAKPVRFNLYFPMTSMIYPCKDTTDRSLDGTVPLVIWTKYVFLLRSILDPKLTINSIEADVVVIASCIPTLHPLLELLTGKRTLASSKSRSQNYYNKYYADASQGQNRSRSRKYTSTSGTLDMENQSVLGDPTLNGSDSQENFIRRTDDVHVEYEMQVQEPPKTLPQETRERTFQ